MKIEINSKDQCLHCLSINKIPPCGVTEFHQNLNLNDLLKREFNKSDIQQYMLCPTDAIKLKDGITIDNSKCITCGLCRSNCPYDNINIYEQINEERVFTYLGANILQIASYIKARFKGINSVTTEVKAKGYSRNRRIDMVIHNGDSIIIIKVLSSSKESKKYFRAYKDILDNIEDESVLKNIGVVFLYTNEQDVKNTIKEPINNTKINWTDLSIDKIDEII